MRSKGGRKKTSEKKNTHIRGCFILRINRKRIEINYWSRREKCALWCSVSSNIPYVARM